MPAKIEKLHIIFEESGIRKGDKIAVCGRNSSHWGVTFLATLTYGAVIVPILHEFKADNVHNIVNHSEAKLLFVGDVVWENLNESAMPLLEGILMMNDFTLLVSRSERLTHAREHLNEMFGKKFPKNFRKEHIEYHKDQPEELAVINYTSGTTSYSKGVMLPYRSLWSNTTFAFEVLPLKAGDKIVSMLPRLTCTDWAFESCMICGRVSDLLPHPYAKPKDYLPGVCRGKTQPDCGCSADYRKNHQEERTSEVGDSYHEVAA